ncbi:MAG: DUF938 domain-containing protein [Geminicoccaceae bacterium]
MAPRLAPGLTWQPSEADAPEPFPASTPTPAMPVPTPCARRSSSMPAPRAGRSPRPTRSSAAISPTSPWAATEGLLAGAARLLLPGGPLVLYGPFRRQGRHTAPSNTAFEASLQAQNPAWRIRCVDSELAWRPPGRARARRLGRRLPANNLALARRRRSLNAA